MTVNDSNSFAFPVNKFDDNTDQTRRLNPGSPLRSEHRYAPLAVEAVTYTHITGYVSAVWHLRTCPFNISSA